MTNTEDNISKAREKFSAALKAKSSWLARRERLQSEERRLEAEIPVLQSRANEAEAGKRQALGDTVEGRAEAGAITTARRSFAAARDRLEEATELLEAVREAIRRTEAEQYAVFAAVEPARNGYVDAVTEPMIQEIRCDEHLRKRLLDAFSGWAALGGDFGSFIERLFPEPNEDEHKTCVERFVSSHIEPLEASE